MRVLHTEFEHVCQHRSLKHVWHPGLNGIVGQNGAGKSNTLKMIEAALTGNFRTNAGNKDENIALLAPAGARSRVVLHVEHGDAKIEVVRALRGCTTEAKVNGGDAVRGDTRVNELLADIFGIDARILSEFVFVKQRNIFTFLDDNDSTRAELFQKLFGTERAPVLYALLGKELSSLGSPQASAEIEPLTQRVLETSDRLTRLRLRQQQYPEAEISATAADTVATYELARRVRQECRELKVEADKVKQQVLDLKSEYTQKKEELEELELIIESEKATVAEAQTARLAWTRCKTDSAARLKLKTERDKLEAEAASLVEVTIPEELANTVAQWEQERDELNQEIAKLERLVTTFDGEVAECPTCGTAAATLQKQVAVARQELPKLQQTQDWYLDAQARFKLAVTRRDAWLKAKQRLDNRLEQLTASEQNFGPALVPPTMTEAQIAEILQDATLYDKELRQRVRPAFDAIQRRVDQLKQRHRVYCEQYWSKRAELPAVVPSKEEYRAARRQVAKDNSLQARRKLLAARIRDHERTLAADQSLLERLQAEADIARKTQAWANELKAMQAAVHYSALPRLVSQENLAAVQDDINELLVRFGVRFRAEVTDRLSFNVRYDDGRVHAATRLSDGQKVVFALAFRVAVNALFTGDIGLFCLDEPTDSLDAKNLACLELALDRLRELSHSRGLQCLLVTHERKLARLFDAVLDLG